MAEHLAAQVTTAVRQVTTLVRETAGQALYLYFSSPGAAAGLLRAAEALGVPAVGVRSGHRATVLSTAPALLGQAGRRVGRMEAITHVGGAGEAL